MSIALLIGSALLLGALVGSFLNVVASRVPARLEYDWARESDTTPADADERPPGIVWPGSRCPTCLHPIRVADNIPLLSYLRLRGRCRDCRAPISPRYPITELLGAALTAAVVFQFGITATTAGLLLLTWWLLALAAIDFETQLLPDTLTLSGLWLGLLFSLTDAALVTPTLAILSAAAGYSALWLINAGYGLLRGRDGMGFGDFKLYAMIGAWVGPEGLITTALLASLGALAVALIGLVIRRFEAGQAIPFGPYLAFGGWLTMMTGGTLPVLV